MSHVVYINTADSNNPNTPHDANWNLNLPFTSGSSTFNYSISFQSFSAPNSAYPFNSVRGNQSVSVSENGGGAFTITIAENFYTGIQLASFLQTELTANSTNVLTYTVTYDTQSNKMTISVPGPDTIQLVAVSNDAYSELGFTNIPSSTASSLTSDYPIDISGTQFVDIIASLSTNNYASNGRTNIFSRVPMTVAFGGILFYENQTDDSLKITDDSLDFLEIQVRDDRGKFWTLPVNANIQYVFKMDRVV